MDNHMPLYCVACPREARYIYLGKSLCNTHFEEWSKSAASPEHSTDADEGVDPNYEPVSLLRRIKARWWVFRVTHKRRLF